MTASDIVVEEVNWANTQSVDACNDETPETCPNHCVCDDYCGKDAEFNC